VALLVDEIHTMPGADYEGFLTELAKYGASLVLATQSLERLRQIDREQGRALRAAVFSNVDGLFAFQVSAADAEYLALELGGGLEPQDLLELGDHRCYARLSVRGERLPAFSVRLDPPPPSDPAAADAVAAESAQRYGRPRQVVEDAIGAALGRIEASQRRGRVPREEDARPRNDHRPPKRRIDGRQQPLPLDHAPAADQAAGSSSAAASAAPAGAATADPRRGLRRNGGIPAGAHPKGDNAGGGDDRT
jgi:hypothetical protein